jgi:hypothetical protein
MAEVDTHDEPATGARLRRDRRVVRLRDRLHDR